MFPFIYICVPFNRKFCKLSVPVHVDIQSQIIHSYVKPKQGGSRVCSVYVSEEEMRIVREEVVEEVKRLWLAVPLFSVGILLHILQAISIMFVGHLGTLPLSGASMASSFASVTGFNLLPFYLFASSKLVSVLNWSEYYYFQLGLATALDTFCGQSNGAGQYHMLGIHMQRSMLVALMT